MNELLLTPARNKPTVPYFLLDFQNSPVGEKGWNVQSTETWNFVRTTQGTPTDGVVDHPTFGKCYRLDGNVAFREPTKRMNLLNRPFFRVEIDFVTDVAYAQLFLTGSQSSGRSGWNAYTFTGASWLWAYIVTTAGSGSSIPALSGSVPLNVMNRISITREGTALTFKNENTGGLSAWQAPSTSVDDSFFCIGCDQANFANSMKGYLKRFQVFI